MVSEILILLHVCKSQNICVGKFYVTLTQARLLEEEELSAEEKKKQCLPKIGL